MTLGATIPLDRTSHEIWDAVVVGAGPAGSAAACSLAAQGARVLLVDRATFPRTKVCGCCLNARSIQSLAALGLDDLPARLGAVPQHEIILAAGSRRAQLPLPGTLSLSREALDSALILRAIALGAHFLPATRAALSRLQPDWREVMLQAKDATVPIRARVVLAADGLAGGFAREALGGIEESPASRIGLGAILIHETSLPDHAILMACARGGYAGLARVEGNRAAIGAAVDPAFLKSHKTPAAAMASIFKSANFADLPELSSLAWRGTPPLTRRPRRVAAPRLFAVGDAAGYIEPFTGEGMAWALAAGRAAAPFALAAAHRWSDSLGADWSHAHRHIVRDRQALCRALAFTLRRPWLTSLAIAAASATPSLARPILSQINRTVTIPASEIPFA